MKLFHTNKVLLALPRVIDFPMSRVSCDARVAAPNK